MKIVFLKALLVSSILVAGCSSSDSGDGVPTDEANSSTDANGGTTINDEPNTETSTGENDPGNASALITVDNYAQLVSTVIRLSYETLGYRDSVLQDILAFAGLSPFPEGAINIDNRCSGGGSVVGSGSGIFGDRFIDLDFNACVVGNQSIDGTLSWGDDQAETSQQLQIAITNYNAGFGTGDLTLDGSLFALTNEFQSERNWLLNNMGVDTPKRQFIIDGAFSTDVVSDGDETRQSASTFDTEMILKETIDGTEIEAGVSLKGLTRTGSQPVSSGLIEIKARDGSSVTVTSDSSGVATVVVSDSAGVETFDNRPWSDLY